jgi:hypothetical protein
MITNQPKSSQPASQATDQFSLQYTQTEEYMTACYKLFQAINKGMLLGTPEGMKLVTLIFAASYRC